MKFLMPEEKQAILDAMKRVLENSGLVEVNVNEDVGLTTRTTTVTLRANLPMEDIEKAERR